MTEIQGISNFVDNINPLIKKLRESRAEDISIKLTSDEAETIVQFYLEVVYLLGNIQTANDMEETR
jgi:hypothetical protein